MDENQPLTTVGFNFAFDGHSTASAYAAKNDIFSNYNAEKSARVCVVRGFNKNNVTPPEVKKDKKKRRTHWQPNTFDSPPGQSTLPYTLVQKGLSTRVHSQRGTVMKMPPEYFTCPFNTSTDGAEERKVRTKRGRREGTKEKAAVHVDAGTGGEAKVPQKNLFSISLRVLHPLLRAVFSFITFNSSDTMLARGISLSRFTGTITKLSVRCYGCIKKNSHREINVYKLCTLSVIT